MAAPFRLRSSSLLPLILAAFAVHHAAGQNTAPVLDQPVPTAPVPANIPVGRALLFPVTATDADGDVLSYTVKSSNPRVLVRAKTGNPFLKFTITHADGGVGDPAFSGDLYFMLLRDWAPITAGFIGGFAQSGFYDTTIFHRISDLAGASTGFIFQGGDPLGTGLGGPGMTGMPPAPATAWKFDNELDPALVFTGRGLLAMANTGTNAQVISNFALGTWADSNGSQFFISNDALIRHLDFKHTIFAQLVRGWELLPNFVAAPRTNAVPNVPITISTASVVPFTAATQSDAVLVFSATGVGTSTITVTVDDRRGGKDTKTFTVTAVKETSNSPPFLRKIAPVVTPKDTDVFFPVEAVDVELDYIQANQLRHFVLQGYPNGGNTSSGFSAGYRPVAGDDGLVGMGFDVNQFDVGAQTFTAARYSTNAFIGVGDHQAIGERVVVEAEPTVPFTGVAGKIRDLDPAAQPGDFTATINWGDGTPLETGTLGRAIPGPDLSVLTVRGTHTYARAGVYPVVVNYSGAKGATGVARSQAIVTSTAIRAAGEVLEITGASVVGRVLATFSDTLSTGNPGDYSATVDWGDGAVTAGVVAQGVEGRFIVRGTHPYRDSERYSVRVKIHRNSDPPGVNDAWAWSSVTTNFRATPHLPPFPKPNLLGAWLSGLAKTFTGVPGPAYRVNLAANFIVINSGNRVLPRAQLRYWLSEDQTLSKATDLPVTVKILAFGNQAAPASPFSPQLSITSFRPTGQQVLTLGFALPRGQAGGRKHIVTELFYPDPLTDGEAIDKEFASSPIGAAIVPRATSALRTTEAGGTATFTVVLDTLPVLPSANITGIIPGNPVTINTTTVHGLTTGQVALISGVTGGTPDLNGAHTVTVVDTDTFTVAVDVTVAGTGGKAEGTVAVPVESADLTEGTVSPSRLVFTVANWNTPQTVTVTGVDDTANDHHVAYLVRLRNAISADALYSGLDPADATLTNLDNDP